MSEFEAFPRLYIASTGAANLASVRALCARAKVEPFVTEDPEEFYTAPKALVPGVGAFGAAMDRLARSGLETAIKKRVAEGRPTMGICLGMQLMCESSEESPGVAGIGVVPVPVAKFATGLPLPQLGWNRVRPAPGSFLKPGWAYFANSYRITGAPRGYIVSRSDYGESFAAAIEEYSGNANEVPELLLCQFHPELSGAWGLDLFRRWMFSGAGGRA